MVQESQPLLGSQPMAEDLVEEADQVNVRRSARLQEQGNNAVPIVIRATDQVQERDLLGTNFTCSNSFSVLDDDIVMLRELVTVLTVPP